MVLNQTSRARVSRCSGPETRAEPGIVCRVPLTDLIHADSRNHIILDSLNYQKAPYMGIEISLQSSK